jgi:methylmalonyl-CoA mutase cobalamin-binding subunit
MRTRRSRARAAEHREPCESRGSSTVLGAAGGEIPPADSTDASAPELRAS